jgi:hypothetical protein
MRLARRSGAGGKGRSVRFASEKDAGESDDEPIELPNWRRGNGTVVN